MKNYLSNILAGFEFNNSFEFVQSLLPTIKYNLLTFFMILGIPVSVINKIFGLDELAFGALIIAMIIEILSGVYASHIRRQNFSSQKFARFTVKSACYLILIAVPYVFSNSYRERGSDTVAEIFEWLHLFFVVQIVAEHIISILENAAIIQGKRKTYWIDKIKSRIGNTL
ncbi:phage holin family protein [Sporocytophaga myxococcoides]|uniref:phage holin family protein n=1 Tax=Sporocytophaga myxococcoides TaxID=153721 RepID=UPI0004183ABC|nr:phage holin family protein [Sporocytophaga myxococcoides]